MAASGREGAFMLRSSRASRKRILAQPMYPSSAVKGRGVCLGMSAAILQNCFKYSSKAEYFAASRLRAFDNGQRTLSCNDPRDAKAGASQQLGEFLFRPFAASG